MMRTVDIAVKIFIWIASIGVITHMEEPKDLYDSFIQGEIPAYYSTGDRNIISKPPAYYEDLEIFLDCCEIGDRMDLDNDGEDELIIKDMCGGMYLDVRDEKVYVLAENYGMVGFLDYANFDGKTYIVHSDTMHEGRENYFFTLYDGNGKIVDSFELNKEYYDGFEVTCSYRGEEISEKEFEKLRQKMLGR